MALLGNIPLFEPMSDFDSGAAFLLSRQSQVNEIVAINESARLEVHPGVSYAIIRFSGASSPEQAFESGHEFIQQGLDLLSIQGKGNLTIRDSADEYLTWWCEDDANILRVVSTANLNFDVPHMKAIVHDKEGREVITPEVKPEYQQAFRYFRLSQVTEDLYDAYRNLYLSFELLLSNKFPISKNEREIDWLNRGLSGANEQLNLSQFLSQSNKNPIQSIIKIIYTEARLPLFHAKEGRDYYPPQSSKHRQAVTVALQLLTKIVLKMNEVWYRARYLGGGVVFDWVYRSMTDLLSSSKMLVSDDDLENDTTKSNLTHVRYQTCTWMKLQLLTNYKTGQGPTLLGRINVHNLGENKTVRRFEVVNDEASIIVHILENNLMLEGIDFLECEFDTKVSNVRQPRIQFPR